MTKRDLAMGWKVERDCNGEYTLSRLADRAEEYYLEHQRQRKNCLRQHYGGRSAGERGDPVHLALSRDVSGMDAGTRRRPARSAGGWSAPATKRPITSINVAPSLSRRRI